MSSYLADVARAHEQRIALIRVLAPDRQCALCGKRKRSFDSLEVDHVDGRDYRLSTLSRWSRAKRYWDEYKAGVRLRAACRRCNAGYNPYREAVRRAA